MDTIEQRLQVLERDLQRSRRSSRTLLLIFVAFSCIAAAQGVTPQGSKSTTPEQTPPMDASRPPEGNSARQDRLRTVEADQFVLLDRLGRSRLTMVVTDGGPAISMFDEKGQKRLELVQSDVSSGLRLSDSSESPVVSLEVPHDVSQVSQLTIASFRGSSLTNADGFHVRDASNQRRLLLALLNGNFPVLGISQSGQNGPFSIEMTAGEGLGLLRYMTRTGTLFIPCSRLTTGVLRSRRVPRSRAFTSDFPTGPPGVDGPSVAFLAPAKEDGTGGQLPFLRFGLHEDCQPYVRIVDRNGRSRFTAPSD